MKERGMLKLLQRLKNFLFGDETTVPDEGKFLLIGGPAHLQIRYTYFTAEIIDDEAGVYRERMASGQRLDTSASFDHR